MINNVLVDDAGVDIGEIDVRVVELSQVVIMDHLLELVPEALCDCLEGVVD